MTRRNRNSELIRNIAFFGISSFGTKLIYFFLVPLYTSYLSTNDYGTVDLISTIVSLLIPVLTMGMIDSVLRFIVIHNEKKENILDCSLAVLAIDTVILCIVVIILKRFDLFHLKTIYYVFLVFSFLTTSLYQILCSYYRGIDQVKCMMIAGLVNAFITCICNVIFLAVFHWGVNGYLAGTLIGTFISALFLIIHVLVKGYYKLSIRPIEKRLFKEMSDYGRPLILNGISWWINNSLDRIIIVSIIGTAANGIYSVSYKIPSILSVFQSIFNQAWTMSAIQEIKSEDKDVFYSKMYRVFEAGMFTMCGLLLMINMPLARILYSKAFYTAWHYTIPLIIAALAGAMCMFTSSVFCAVGNTKIIGYTTLIGAIINLILNIVIIPFIGLLGAAIATVISNLVIWAVRMFGTMRYIKIDNRPLRELICLLAIIIQAFAAYQESHIYWLQAIAFAIIIVAFREEIKMYINKGVEMIKIAKTFMKTACK